MPELNQPMQPDVIDPIPHAPIAGDTHDDDGTALDQYFESMDLQPVIYDAIPDDSPETLPQTTRLISRSYSLVSPDGATFPDPVMILPPDPNRIRLLIHTDNGQALVRIGETKDTAYFGAALNSSGQELDLTGHTGAVWAYYASAAAATNVHVFAVSM